MVAVAVVEEVEVGEAVVAVVEAGVGWRRWRWRRRRWWWWWSSMTAIISTTFGGLLHLIWRSLNAANAPLDERVALIPMSQKGRTSISGGGIDGGGTTGAAREGGWRCRRRWWWQTWRWCSMSTTAPSSSNSVQRPQCSQW